MKDVRKVITSVFEYLIIIIIFFIALRKGGYYKQDSLLLIYFIQIISLGYYILNIKDMKANGFVSGFLVFFSVAYFLAAFINATSVSGALNIATRIYSMTLIYFIVSSSKAKSKFINSIIISCIIFSILGIDEISYRIFDKPLSFIGGGYLDENVDSKLSSVFEYANLMGILCVLCIMYLLNYVQKNDLKAIVKSGLNTLIMFFTIIIFLTGSKMCILLLVISLLVICIHNRENSNIVLSISTILFGLIVSTLVLKYNIYLVLCLACIIYYIYSYIYNYILDKNIKHNILINRFIDILTFVILAVIIILNLDFFIQNPMLERINEYFSGFDSTKLRITYYKDALKLSTSNVLNFIFGIGGNGFRTAYEIVQTSEYISLEVHSFFMQILVEAGILGLISIILILGYIFFKSKNNIYKLMLIILVIFAAFDVYLTYTYMLFILAIIMGLCNINKTEVSKMKKGLFILISICVLIFTTTQVLAYIIEPNEVDNLNVTLQKQSEIIARCELALKFDPYDLNYRDKYTLALRSYLDIMDVKKELYMEDDVDKRKEIVQKIVENVKQELKYEKQNKYAIEDLAYNIYKYIDYVVEVYYPNDISYGYEYYLNYLLENLEDLEKYHSYNSVANLMYQNALEKIYNKYMEINIIIQNDEISKTLDTLEKKLDMSNI